MFKKSVRFLPVFVLKYVCRYKTQAEVISEMYRDQPLPPLELAKFWVEYVIRHKGAIHIQSPGKDMTFLVYHNLDVFVFLIVIAGICVIFMKRLIKSMYQLHLKFKRDEINKLK